MRDEKEHIMENNREELKKKALDAASAEEIMELVRAAGKEIMAEEAAKLFEKIQEQIQTRNSPSTSWKLSAAEQTGIGLPRAAPI